MNHPQKLSLGISPCPNDTFIFSALIKDSIDNVSFDFNVNYLDVQTLNELALVGKSDILKVSFGVWPKVRKDYLLLNCGGAMGYGCGPLLLIQNGDEFKPDQEIWVPGENTTARFLLESWFIEKHPSVSPKFKFALFDEVYQKINCGEINQAVVIHECRFTYEQDGLKLHKDLGEWWEKSKNLPIPLGGILLHRKWSHFKEKIEELIRASIEECNQNPFKYMSFIAEKAQISDQKVIESHIETYVNDFSIKMGEIGIRAISKMSGVPKNLVLK